MKKIIVLAALSCSLAVSANILNQSSATYKDATGAIYSAQSNTVSVTTITPPVITLSKTVSPTTAKSGDILTFTITFAVTGGPAQNVVITDMVPTGTTFVTGSQGGIGFAISGSTMTWTIGSLGQGASGIASFQAQVN